MALLAARPATAQDDNSDYINSVCSPEGDFTPGNIPPCIDIINIEAACQPNGTSSLALEAHAQCMCSGSYFPEWLGCRQCLFDHGGLSERNLTYYSSVIATASSLLCSASSPTAPFAALFASAAAEVPIPTTGGTVLSDIQSGDAAVGVYYTATGSQGPGRITGSATAATATGAVSSGTGSGAATKTSSSGSSGSSKTTAAGSGSSRSSSANFAGPTAAPAAKNVLLALAGGVIMAAM
ncbi:hypothetical protein KJ359_006559 [Pestalotiopsis sp. 9143b]|nr:hypothetical protein KJ359_001020 [Pestalotiopsis sp. 9143b]KAI4595920.1 hypothetical protein KJ359_006559 [Pestalotiopsis sp. 9143b]